MFLPVKLGRNQYDPCPYIIEFIFSQVASRMIPGLLPLPELVLDQACITDALVTGHHPLP
jgi:hypothetical protein